MFLDNKYTKIYFSIISKQDNEGYTENHHIIPRCMGGADDPQNITTISARKHFLCHYLLIKMVPHKSPEFWKLIKAFNMMNGCPSSLHQRYWNSRLFEKHRKEFAESMALSQKGNANSQFGTVWIYCPFTLVSKKIPKSDLQKHIENGCIKGRITNIENFINKNKEKTKTNFKKRYDKKQHNNDQKAFALNLYNKFKKSNLSYRDFCKSINYQKSHVSLYLMFKKHGFILWSPRPDLN